MYQTTVAEIRAADPAASAAVSRLPRAQLITAHTARAAACAPIAIPCARAEIFLKDPSIP
jgi:hypothetical protein